MNQHTNLHSAKNPINSATLLAIYAEIAIEGRGIVRQKHGIDAILFVAVLHFPPSVLLTRCNSATISPLTPINSFIWIANQSFLASGLPIYHFYISSEVPIYHFCYLDCQFIISIIWIAKHYQLDTAWFSELKSVSDNFPKFGSSLTHDFVQG